MEWTHQGPQTASTPTPTRWHVAEGMLSLRPFSLDFSASSSGRIEKAVENLASKIRSARYTGVIIQPRVFVSHSRLSEIIYTALSSTLICTVVDPKNMGRSRVETEVPDDDNTNSIDTMQVQVELTGDNDQHNTSRLLGHAETVLMKFLRPRRMIPTPAQRKLFEATEVETFTVDVASVPIRTYVFGGRTTANSPSPSQRTVLLSHGFLMNAASMLKFVRPLRSAGFRVVVWDHCGHGESGGDFTDLRVWVRTVRVMVERYAPIAGVVGFSMGGTVALMALADREWAQERRQKQEHAALEEGEHAVAPRVPALVCVNPPTQTDTVLKGFLRARGYDRLAADEMVALVHRVAEQKNVFLPERVRQILSGARGALAATRVLVVQDRHDSVASVGEAEWVVDHLRVQPGSGREQGLARRSGRGSGSQSVQLRFTEHLDHHGALADEGVIRAVTEFVTGKDSGKGLGRSSRL